MILCRVRFGDILLNSSRPANRFLGKRYSRQQVSTNQLPEALQHLDSTNQDYIQPIFSFRKSVTYLFWINSVFAGSRRNISKSFPVHNLLQVDLSQNIHLVNDRCHVRRFIGMNQVHCTWPVLRLHWPSRSIYFRWRNANRSGVDIFISDNSKGARLI